MGVPGPSDPVVATEPLLIGLRERLERLRAELAGPPGAASRDRLRDELVSLGRATEKIARELDGVRAEIRPLAERYRELFPREARPVAPTRVDHLGSSTYRERGWSALAAGEWEEAERELRRALELEPEEVRTLVLLTWALTRGGALPEARDVLESVLRREPAHPLARVVRGYLEIREGDAARATETLTDPARDGTDRTARMYGTLYLGVAYAEREMYREAQRCFRSALELGPNLTEAFWEMGRAHDREGRQDLALEAWKAGGENRFSRWGERCAAAALELDERHAPG